MNTPLSCALTTGTGARRPEQPGQARGRRRAWAGRGAGRRSRTRSRASSASWLSGCALPLTGARGRSYTTRPGAFRLSHESRPARDHDPRRPPPGRTAIAGDGQVTLGQTVVKQRAKQDPRLHNGQVLAGFAGSTADALALSTKFEAKLEEYRGNLRAGRRGAVQGLAHRPRAAPAGGLPGRRRPRGVLPALRLRRRDRARRRAGGGGQRRPLRPGRRPRPRPPHRARRRGRSRARR